VRNGLHLAWTPLDPRRILFTMLHAQLQPDSLLLAGSVARVFEVSPQAVREWERTGRLPARRILCGTRVLRGSDVLRLQRERSAVDASTEIVNQ
jgi:hypothetical protein